MVCPLFPNVNIICFNFVKLFGKCVISTIYEISDEKIKEISDDIFSRLSYSQAQKLIKNLKIILNTSLVNNQLVPKNDGHKYNYNCITMHFKGLATVWFIEVQFFKCTFLVCPSWLLQNRQPLNAVAMDILHDYD